MLLNFFLFFIPALLVMVVSHYVLSCKYSVKELLVQLVATLVVVSGVILIDNYSQVTDTMHVNGVVSDKQMVQRSCMQTWSTSKDSWCEVHYTRTVTKTRLARDADGNMKTETYFETQYYPKYPWERKYYVKTTLGDYKIERVDQQGVYEPPFYKNAKRNDPVTSTKSYTNYVKAASDTLFRHSDDAYPELKVKMPAIYDYYNIDRVVFTHDVSPEFLKEHNRRLSEINSAMSNNANLIVYVTEYPEDFATSLQVKWDGFRLNDVVVVLGLDKPDNMYQYVRVFSWSESSSVEVLIKDHFVNKNINSLYEDLQTVGSIINSNYVEPDPAKFDYLKYDVKLSWFSYILLWVITLIVTPAVTYFFCRNEIF